MDDDRPVVLPHLSGDPLTQERTAVVEAGTGTGKTFGYLIPVVRSGKKAVVSTGTKNLQEQIYHKDIPLLRQAMGLPIDAMIMKGRKNYLCLHKYHQFFIQPSMLRPGMLEAKRRMDEWLRRTEFADRSELSWLADGRGLTLASGIVDTDVPGWRGLYTLDLETGEYAPIEGSGGLPWWTPLSRDRRTAYYSPWLEDPNLFRIRDLATGTDRDLVRLDTIWEDVRVMGRAYLSPDDRWMAASVTHRDPPPSRSLVVISTESGEVRELFRHEPFSGTPRTCGTFLWTPDGSAVLFGRPTPDADDCTLYRVPIEGGEPVPVLRLPEHRRSSLSPDGTRLAYQAGEFRGEIWVMEYGGM